MKINCSQFHLKGEQRDAEKSYCNHLRPGHKLYYGTMNPTSCLQTKFYVHGFVIIDVTAAAAAYIRSDEK